MRERTGRDSTSAKYRWHKLETIDLAAFRQACTDKAALNEMRTAVAKRSSSMQRNGPLYPKTSKLHRVAPYDAGDIPPMKRFSRSTTTTFLEQQNDMERDFDQQNTLYATRPW